MRVVDSVGVDVVLARITSGLWRRRRRRQVPANVIVVAIADAVVNQGHKVVLDDLAEGLGALWVSEILLVGLQVGGVVGMLVVRKEFGRCQPTIRRRKVEIGEVIRTAAGRHKAALG